MSGRIGARGYVYQGIIAVLNCLETEVWDEIKVEPLTANDKVDIIMKKSGVVVKAIQVKLVLCQDLVQVKMRFSPS